MFTARITCWYDKADGQNVVELGSFATGGAAFRALKAALAARPTAFQGEVVRGALRMFAATNPCPEWVR